MLELSPEYALQQLENMPSHFRISSDIRLHMAQHYISLNQDSSAIAQYQQLLKFGDQRQLALFNIGRVYQLYQQPEKALTYYRQVTEDNLVSNASGYGYELMDNCLLYTSPSPRDRQKSRMPSSA